MIQVECKSMYVLAAIGSSPVLEAHGDVVEEPFRPPCDRSERATDDDEEIEEERREVLVIGCGCLRAGLPSSIVNGIGPVQHINRLDAVERG